MNARAHAQLGTYLLGRVSSRMPLRSINPGNLEAWTRKICSRPAALGNWRVMKRESRSYQGGIQDVSTIGGGNDAHLTGRIQTVHTCQ